MIYLPKMIRNTFVAWLGATYTYRFFGPEDTLIDFFPYQLAFALFSLVIVEFLDLVHKAANNG